MARFDVLGLLALVSCTLSARTTPEQRVQPEEVSYAGCERVIEGPVCQVRAGQRLTLWKPTSFAGQELWLGERRVAAVEQPVAGGYQVQIDAAGEAARLRLQRGKFRTFELELAPFQSSELLSNAQTAKDAGDLPRALELAAALKERGSVLERALADGLRARVELRLGQAESAAALLEGSARQLFGLGQLSEASRDVFARLFILLERASDPAQARAWLDRHRAKVGLFPLGRALLRDHEGMLHASTGELSEAMHDYSVAASLYERLGEHEHARRVAKERVGVLSELGQLDQARELQESLLPPPAGESDCGKAQAYVLYAWLSVLDVEEGGFDRSSDVGRLLSMSEAWERRCGDPEIVATGLINRGLWALRAGDLERVEQIGAELRGLPQRKTPDLRAWMMELEGRIALAGGQAQRAREAFEAEHLIGRASGSFDAELRALIGSVDALEAERKRDEAGALLRRALGELKQVERGSALAAPGSGEFSARQRAARHLIERLVSRGRLSEAWRVGVSAYGAALRLQARHRNMEGWPAEVRERWRELTATYRQQRRDLDRAAENDWQLSLAELSVAQARREDARLELEELFRRAAALVPKGALWDAPPRPAPGEYWLLVMPAPSEPSRWIALGTDGESVQHAELAAELAIHGGAGAADHPLLAPFSEPLSRAARIVLLPAGPARQWAFEEFRLGGEPLSARRVAFGTALEPLALGEARRVAFVSSDPRGDLPFSRREADLVTRVLQIPEARRMSGASVSPSNLLKQLEAADYWHFAGHARRARGQAGAALLLSHGSELSPWELFSLKSVPREVVLSACEAGDAVATSSGVGWGFARGLLALGAETVVAPIRAVGDRDAFAFQSHLYAALSRGLDLREAFWQARRAEPFASAPFRLFVR